MCEADVNAAVSATKDAMHFKLMLLELGLMLEDTPIKIMEDNSACIAQAEGGIYIMFAMQSTMKLSCVFFKRVL
jgi:hypothetical protein